MVFVFVHLHDFIMYIVGQVISKIAIIATILGSLPTMSFDTLSGGHDWFACSPSWAIFFPARRSFNL